MVDPNTCIIARKRKKYRFALFHNATNCFELEEWQASSVRSEFLKSAAERPLVLEIGAGTGLFSVEMAKRYPDKRYIALDVKADRLQRGARLALELGLDNIVFVRARADQLLSVVTPHAVSDIWLTFSDPFPKKRDAKRRLTHPKFLEIYKKIHVGKNAQLVLKTDSHALFDWSLEQLVTNGWRLSKLSYDLHASDFSDDYTIMTTYEQRWVQEGLPVCLVAARRT